MAFSYVNGVDCAAELERELATYGNRIRSYPMEVRDRGAIRRVFSDIEQQFGALHILVNNAGINKPSDFNEVTEQDWDEVLSVNLKGPFLCSQEALPLMERSGGGSIIMISSVSGQYGGPRTAHYAASKAGLLSLAQVIARFAAARKIRCNSIAAGLIASEMAANSIGAASVQKAAAGILLGRMGSMDEVARAVVFLASDDSSYITAQTVNVNGGLYF